MKRKDFFNQFEIMEIFNNEFKHMTYYNLKFAENAERYFDFDNSYLSERMQYKKNDDFCDGFNLIYKVKDKSNNIKYFAVDKDCDDNIIIWEELAKIKLYVSCKESGDRICEVASLEDGIKLIKEYEAEDKKNNEFCKKFYSIDDDKYRTIYY